MSRSRTIRRSAATALGLTLVLSLVGLTAPAGAAATPVLDASLARSPELQRDHRLPERRTVVSGDRAWVLGTADGRFPAAGFHTRGEMGGFWPPNLKLLDGVWFGSATPAGSARAQDDAGWGYVRTDLARTDGVAPAGPTSSRTASGALVGLTLRADRARTVTLRVDAHSELMAPTPGARPPRASRTSTCPTPAAAAAAPGVPRPRHPARAEPDGTTGPPLVGST